MSNILDMTYREKVPSYDESKDFGLDFGLTHHWKIRRLFQQVDFLPIGLVALTELTYTLDITTHLDRWQFAIDMRGRNYARKPPWFESEV